MPDLVRPGVKQVLVGRYELASEPDFASSPLQPGRPDVVVDQQETAGLQDVDAPPDGLVHVEHVMQGMVPVDEVVPLFGRPPEDVLGVDLYPVAQSLFPGAELGPSRLVRRNLEEVELFDQPGPQEAPLLGARPAPDGHRGFQGVPSVAARRAPTTPVSCWELIGRLICVTSAALFHQCLLSRRSCFRLPATRLRRRADPLLMKN